MQARICKWHLRRVINILFITIGCGEGGEGWEGGEGGENHICQIRLLTANFKTQNIQLISALKDLFTIRHSN